MQHEILRAVFRSIDQELVIRPLNDEQIKAFNLRLDAKERESNQQV